MGILTVMSRKFDYRLLGIAVGFITTLIILYGVNVFNFKHLSYGLFLKTGFYTGTINPFLQIASLFNLAPFFLFINQNKLKTAQGVVLATIVNGIIIAYFVMT